MRIDALKRWAAVLLTVAFACGSAFASAQTYRVGDEDDEIKLIQTALKQLKFYSADITGHFGEQTEAAVKKFQKKYALEDDGIVGHDTLQALYDAAGITSGSTVSQGSTLLRRDSEGTAVRQLQQDLTTLGYYGGTISGHFGTQTEAAVMSFQRHNGLSADGIAGENTLAKIAAALGGKQNSASSSSQSSQSSSTLLKHGVSSEAVRTLQQNLKTLGYYTGTVTGNFGNLTKDAVMKFQRANGLSADGVAGEKTLAKIAAAVSGSSSSTPPSSSGGTSSAPDSLLNTNNTLQLNSKSNEVLKMQKMLKSLGYYSGNLTGNFGDRTKEAVMAFQRAKGLTADGIAGKKTLAAINADVSGGVTSSGGSNGSIGSSIASHVIYENFYNWRRNYANGEYCTVYDPSTGYSWRLRILSKDAHMDAEPVTADDTAVMYKAFGNKTTWNPKVVFVTFSDGKTYIGSTHNTPHETQHITDNNFNGHLCVHFPIPMATANKIGDYATSHQEAINEYWEKMK